MQRFEDIDWVNLWKSVKKLSKGSRWAANTFRLINLKRKQYGLGCSTILGSNDCKSNVSAETEFSSSSLRSNLCWNRVQSMARYFAIAQKTASESILGNICRKGWFGRFKTNCEFASSPTSRFGQRVDSLDLFARPIGNSLPVIFGVKIAKLSLRSIKKAKFDEKCFRNGVSSRGSPRISLPSS